MLEFRKIGISIYGQKKKESYYKKEKTWRREDLTEGNDEWEWRERREKEREEPYLVLWPSKSSALFFLFAFLCLVIPHPLDNLHSSGFRSY